MYQALAPSRFFPLQYQLGDGASAPTRYVRAVIKNAQNLSTLATVDLTDNGAGDFSDYSKTPIALNIDEGLFVKVTTTVYKDSGFTNDDIRRYAVRQDVYLIQSDTGAGSFLASGRTKAAIKAVQPMGTQEIRAVTQNALVEVLGPALAGVATQEDLQKIISAVNDVLLQLTNDSKAISNDNKAISQALSDLAKVDKTRPLAAKIEALTKQFSGDLETIKERLGDEELKNSLKGNTAVLESNTAALEAMKKQVIGAITGTEIMAGALKQMLILFKPLATSEQLQAMHKDVIDSRTTLEFKLFRDEVFLPQAQEHQRQVEDIIKQIESIKITTEEEKLDQKEKQLDDQLAKVEEDAKEVELQLQEEEI